MRCALLSAGLIFIVSIAIPARGDVTLPKVFGDNMVLQRDMADPVWGHAAGGEKITVNFADQTKTTQADADGHWLVHLDPISASDTPRDLTVTGSSTVTFHNVLVGEVWLCSGQSNMEYPMLRQKWAPPPRSGPDQIPGELASANDPSLRLLLVEKKLDPADIDTDGWNACETKSLAPFSATAYYFGKELRQQLKVPVGLIDDSWGGQKIQRFVTPQAYIADPFFQLPSADFSSQYDGAKIGDIYHFMIQPLVPFAIRGAIWYQGEANVSETTAQYAHQMHALITGWRSVWGEGDFPFYYVQLAPFHYAAAQTRKKKPAAHPPANRATPQSLPDIWQAQAQTLTVPSTGMAETIDITDTRDNIHPPDKWDLGHRLALWALAKNYGRKDLIYFGPLYKSLEIQGDKAIVHFDFVGSGLVSRDDKPLTSFTIAGSDGKFVPATAEISGDTVIVTSPQVAAPTAVRFAWIEDADPNLSNKDGLPAFPFESDAPPYSN